MLRLRQRSLLRSILLVVMLLLPGLLPLASANAARQAERLALLEPGDRASSVRAQQIENPAPEQVTDAPIVDQPRGVPALDLSWDSETATVGVPLTMRLRAVDA